jgi:hypothetical protein
LVALLAHQPRAENRLGQLLDEQRNAVRLHDDLLQDVVRQRLAASHALDHRDRLRSRESVEGKRRHIAPLHPGCLELRPERDDRQHALVLQTLERPAHQIQCRGIYPMGVFQQEKHRSVARQPGQQRDQRLDRPILDHARRLVQRIVPAFRGDREQRCQEGNRVGPFDVRPVRHRLKLRKSDRRWFIRRKFSGVPDLVYRRIEGLIGVMRRALIPHRDMRLRPDLLPQFLRDPGLADAGFAGKEDDLAVALAGRPPAIQQNRHFVGAPDDLRQGFGLRRFETTDVRFFVQNFPGVERLGEALERSGIERLHLEPRAQKLSRRGAHDDRVGLGQ